MYHDGPLCAALGHYVWHVAAVYCPHTQGWTLVVGAGDDADDQYLDGRTIRFGPFDSTDDVVRELTGEVARGLRVTSRVWLDRRARRDGDQARADEPF